MCSSDLEDLKIPQAPLSPTRGSYTSFELLQGHSLQELLMTEYQATSLVLTKQRRPQATFQIDRLDERSIGALIYTWSLLTAVTGALWGVNPFDQPGVEEGKIYTKEALTRSRNEGISSLLASEQDENSPVNRLRRNQD